MRRLGIGIILIILGLIVLAFPALGLVPAAIVTGFLVLFLGLGLLFMGIMEIGQRLSLGIIEIIIAIIAIGLGIGFIVDASLFAFVAGFIVYIVGIFLIIAGIINLITKSDTRWTGIVAIIIGLLYLIIGTLVAHNPLYLGILIGLWLLIMGIIFTATTGK